MSSGAASTAVSDSGPAAPAASSPLGASLSILLEIFAEAEPYVSSTNASVCAVGPTSRPSSARPGWLANRMSSVRSQRARARSPLRRAPSSRASNVSRVGVYCSFWGVPAGVVW